VRDLHRDLAPLPADPTSSPLVDFRGIVHCHSLYSHDSNTPLEEIRDAAEATGVGFVVVTDHTNPAAFEHGWRGMHGRTLFLLGQEISRRGSILAVGTKRLVDPADKSTPEILADVRAAGGLPFIGHFEKTEIAGLEDFVGVGIVNLHAAWRERGVGGWASAIGNLLYSGRSFPEEVFQETLAYVPLVRSNLARWDELTLRRRTVAISETDAHGNVRFLGLAIDTYDRLFRVVSTHVLSRVLDEESILAALEAGHAYVAFDGYAPSCGFAFEALSHTRVVAMQGDEVDLAGGLDLVATFPSPASLKLVRNGITIAAEQGERLSRSVDLPGVYRVEAWLRIRGEERPWIFSNPIYVR
jgi:hypothetical protein